ncbi:uncharacterized protein [Halyomorpha halys]|uniref:uncharacterized protein n=1 Tax=Halyomorpha halys TaxID=286706 RepID=UPI0006D4C9A4|nr:uncharacterized protein LOC106688387 [Halyomorpha halys]
MVVNTLCKVLALVCFIHVCAGAKKWDELSVRFDILKSRGFHRIPKTISDPLIQNYIQVEPEKDFKLPVNFYCYPDDPRACFMFDKKGNVVGFQTSFLKKDVANVDPSDYDYQAVLHTYKETNFFGIPAYSFRAYITNPEKLTEEGRAVNDEIGDGLWVYIKGELIEIPRKMPEGDRFGDFYKQGCLRSMGRHFFYKVDKNIKDCKENFAFFPLYEDGELVGCGLATPGKGTAGKKRDWYEYPPKLALSIITPNRPQCLDDLASKYGQTSMHVYFVKRPWDISCNCFDKLINFLTDWIPI